MVQLHHSAVSLRIAGDDLIPDDITRLLGAPPTSSYRKGDVKQKTAVREYLSRTGIWILDAADCKPENIDGQVAEILNKLTDDLSVWASLAQKFEIDLFCGWFMEETNEGLSVSPRTLSALAVRGIELGVDIYAPLNEREEPASS